MKQIFGNISETVLNEVPSVPNGDFKNEIPSPLRDYSKN
jgi:hypothetical protein